MQEERGAAKVQLKEVTKEKDHLRAKVQDLNNKVDQLNQVIQDFKTRERLLEQRIKQLEVGFNVKVTGALVFVFCEPEGFNLMYREKSCSSRKH